MEVEKILPVISTEQLQEKVNEFAFKGATECIKEFYSGYNSPYTKAIKEQLEKTQVSHAFTLPDIIATINDSLTAEIDRIANTAISKTFIPLVKRFLTRANDEMKFSEILYEFIECMDSEDQDDFYCEINRDSRWGWINVEISFKETSYRFTLHTDSDSEKEPVKKYILLSLPRGWDSDKFNTMKLTIGEATLEMPFTSNVLDNKFISFIARLIIARTKIVMDSDSFTEELFHE